jgi:acylphosphatase
VTPWTRAHVLVSGRVQGVGFRYSAAREARRRLVGGWVRNLDTGQVEAVFEGPRDAVEEMVAWCREGPPGAWVRDVSVVRDEPPEGLRQFETRPTVYGRGWR